MRKKSVVNKVLLLAMAFCIVSFMLASLHAQTKTTTPTTKPTPVKPTTAAATPTTKPTKGPQYGGTLRIGTYADARPTLGYPPKLILGYPSLMSAAASRPSLGLMKRVFRRHF